VRIAFHAAAERELKEVADHYDRQLSGLGAEFYHELGTILDLLEPNPWMETVYFGPYRRVLMQRFPFAVYYEVADSRIRIVAIAHQRRLPGYWKGRE
jgi:plasmid stabilization system protein ParE